MESDRLNLPDTSVVTIDLLGHQLQFSQVSINCSPFKVVYGRDPPSLMRFERGSTAIASLEEQLLERDAIVDDIKAHLLKVQHRMKKQEDTKRREVEFEVGDLVYLKLQPCRQQSLAKRVCEKLTASFYGPFLVVQRVGKVAYKLELPETAKIHPVFHISQLKKAIGSRPVSPTIPPQITADLTLEAEPEAVLGVRSHPTDQSITEVLLKWVGLPDWEAT